MVRLLAMILLVAGVSACERTPAGARGQSNQNPRIVALSPALAVTLRDLGLGDRIVGRHRFDMVLDDSLPICGDQSGIDYEALLRVNPTHVLIQQARVPPRLATLARSNGWDVLNLPTLSLEDIERATELLWRTFAPPGVGPPKILLRMRRAWSGRGTDLRSGARVLLLMSVDPPQALGPGSFHQQILERLGGTPAISAGRPYMRLGAEDVARLAPEAIVLIVPRPVGSPQPPDPTWEQIRGRLGVLGRLDLPAVRARHVALIDDPLSLTPSTAMIDFADRLAEILSAWAGP